jgi:hypothetical protein
MASRTQLRLAQITGSFGRAPNTTAATTGIINDQIAATATGSINSADLNTVLSHMAGAIKRVHGKASFSNNAASTLQDELGNERITYIKSAATLIKGGGAGVVATFSDSGDNTATFDASVVLGNDANRAISIEDVSGTDQAGKNLTIEAGSPTGAGVGGSIIFATAPAGSSGTAVRAQATALTIDQNKLATFAGNIKIPDGGTIGSDTTAAAITISADGDVTVAGGLTVTGDVDYKYVTSSIVEMNDPMLVINAFDQTGNAGQLRTGAAFHNAIGYLENDTRHDYGLIYKRSAPYSEVGGAGITSQQSIPSLTSPENPAKDSFNDGTNAPATGSPFAIFKMDKASPFGQDTQKGNLTNNTIRSFKLQDARRSGVRVATLLDTHRGAYVVVSGSHSKKLGIIVSGSAALSQVCVQLLADNQLYNGLKNNAGGFNTAATEPQHRLDVGSIHLLSAYAGNIFDKETNTMHVAAAALTGSTSRTDNLFASGSANVMLYANQAAGRFSLFNNDFVSGSTEQAYLEHLAEGPYSQLISPTNDLLIRAGALGNANNKLILSGTNVRIELAGVPGANGQLIGVDANGDLTYTNAALADANEHKAVFKVKNGVTITAGFGRPNVGGDVNKPHGLCLSASNNSSLSEANNRAASEHFERVDPGHTTNIISGLSTISDAQLFKKLEVYVNGQLLTSGAAAANSGGVATGDYCIVSRTASFLSGAFAFDLEEDDVITLVRKL